MSHKSIFSGIGRMSNFLSHVRFSTTFKLHQKATRLKWYKKWHENKYATNVHKATLLAFALSLFVFVGLQMVFPYSFSLNGFNVQATQQKSNKNDGPVAPTTKIRTYMKNVKSIGGGKFQAEVYDHPVQYLDPIDGQWKDIDTSLQTPVGNTTTSADKVSGKKDQQIVVNDNTLTTSFSTNPSQDLTVTTDGGTITTAYLDVSTNPGKVTDNSILYTDAYKNTDIERTVLAGEVKQNLIFKETGHPTTIKEKLETTLRVEIQPDNSINYYNKDNSLIATTPPINIVDTDGTKEAVTLSYSNSVLTITLPLKLRRLTYPIVIDPTISVNPASADDGYVTKMIDAYGAASYATNTNSTLNYANGINSDCSTLSISCNRTFLRFSLAGLGPITSATINTYGYTAGTGTVYHTAPFTLGTDPAATDWALATDSGQTLTQTIGGLSTETVTAAVSADYSASRTYTYFAIYAGAAGTDVDTYSVDNTTNKPYLSVTYTAAATPAAPTSFAGSATSTTSIHWSWTDNSTNETSFIVHDGSEGLKGTVSSTTSATTGTVYGLDETTGLTANTQYTRHAHAVNANGNSTSSNIVSKYTLPNTPTGLAVAVASSTQLNVSWVAPAGGASVYHLYRGGTQVGGDIATTSYNDTGLTPNTQYTYTVKAVNADNAEGTATAGVAKYTLTNVPASAAATAASVSQINVSWTAPSVGTVTSYHLKSSLDAYASNIYSSTGLAYSQTSLAANTQYTYRVYGVNGDGTESATYATIAKYTLTNVPASAAATAASVSQINVTWTAPSVGTVTSYHLKSSLDAYASNIYSSTGLAYSQTSLAANTQYTYRVYGVNGDGIESATYATISKYTWANIATGVSVAVASMNQLNITWAAPTGGVSSYHLYRGVTQVGGNIVTTSYNDTGLTPNVQYTYTIKSVNPDSIEGAATTGIAKYTLTDIPTSPAATAASVSQINVSWAAPATGTVSSYHLKSSLDSYASNIYSSTGLSYSQTSLAVNTQYTYRIYGVNGDGTESATYATIAKYTWPNAPTSQSAAAASATQMNVSWTAPAGGAYHYHVRSSSDAYATIKYDNTTAAFNETGLTANTQYTYRIYSVNADSTENANYVSTAAKYTWPNIPTGLTVNVASATQLNVSWTAPVGGASVYHLYRGVTQVGGDIATTSYNDTSLTANTQYTYTVKSVNADGVEGAATTGVAKYTLTNVPASISASASSTSQLDVSWTAPAVGTVASYHLKSSLDAYASNIYSSTGLSYSQTSLTVNTQYTYRIYGVNGDGTESATYATVAKYTWPNAPTAQSAVAASDTQVNVTWSAPTTGGASRYQVRSSSDAYATVKYDNTTAAFNETGLTGNTAYTYRIYAANADDVVNTGYVATTPVTTWVGAPTAPVATASSNTQINVSWTAPAGGAYHYHVRSSSDAYATVKYDNAATSWNETGLTANTSYTYHIYSTNTDNIENSNYIMVTRYTLSNDPSVLPSSAAWTNNSAVSFTNQATSVAKYKYVWDQSSADTSWTGTETDWTLSGNLNLTMSATGNWYLHLRSYNSDTPAVAGSTTNYKVGPFQFDNAGPTGTTLTWGTIAQSGIQIVGAGATDTQSGVPSAAYYIERDDNATTFVTADANSGWITGSWSQTGLTPNTPYAYHVKSRDNLGNESAWVSASPVYKYTLASIPDAPTVTNVALSTTSLNVKVNEATNPSTTVYAIQEAGGQYAQTPSAGNAALGASAVWLNAAGWGSASGVNITGLSANTQYTFTVKARNLDGVETLFSSSAARYTLANAPTAQTAAAASATQMNVSWTAPAGGAYHYHVRSSSDAYATVKYDNTSTSFNETSLTANTQYTYRIYSVNADNTENTNYVSTAAKYTWPNVPTDPTVTVASSTQLNISWTVPLGGASVYHLYRGVTQVGGDIATTSYNDTSLTANTQYTYTVKSVNADGVEGAATTGVAKYTLTNVPASISASASSTSQLDVSWTAPAVGTVASYHLKSSLDAYASNIYSSTGLSYSQTSLTVNTQYTYRIYGVNGDGTESATYATVAKYTWPNAPTAQSAVAASDTQVNVTWSAPTTGGASRYQVRSSSDAYATVKYDNTTAAFNETGLTGNTAYTYRIYAANADDVVNTGYVATTPVTTWVGAPTAPVATASSNTQINVSWTAPAGGAYHYHVRSSSDAYATVKYDNAATSWNETGLTANTSYTYHIYSTNTDNIENSNYIMVTRYTLSNDPSVLPSSAAWTNNSAVSFTNQATSVAKYKYVWDQSSADTSWTGTETDWTLSGNLNLTMSATGNWYLHLRSYNSDTPAVAGSTTNYKVGPFQFDNAGPTGTTLTWGTIAQSGIQIVGAGATDTQSGVPSAAYYIERDDNATTFVTADANSGWITGSWSQTGLTPNTPYAYHVKSRDNLGNESAWVSASPVYKYTLASIPDAPTVTNVALSTTSLNVKVNEATNPSTTVYAIQEAGGQYAQTPSAGNAALGASAVWLNAAGWGSASGVNITGLSANTQYTFTVKARNLDGVETLFSSSAARYTLIQVPTGLTFGTINQTSIAMTASGSLSNLTTATSGLYFENTTATANSGWTQTNSWTSTSLAANTQYSIHIKARNGDGTETAYTTAALKYTMTNAPTGQTALASATTQINVTWAAPAGGASRYHVRSSSDGYTTIKYDNTSAAFSETGLTGNTAYTYRIYAVNADLLENPSYVATAPETTWVDAPTGQSASAASTTQMNVFWTAPAGGADHYHVRSSSDNYATLKYDNTGTSFNETGLTANTSYTYHIYSVGAGNVENTNYVTTAAKYTWPNAPTGGSAVAASNTQMNVTWIASVGGTDHYHVRSSSDNYATVKYDNSAVTSWNEAGLSANTQYTYRIYAVNADNVENSNYIATAGKYTWPNAPTGQSASASSTVQIDVSWAAPAGGSDHYRVRSSSDSYVSIKYEGSSLTWSETGLNPNSAYTYRISSVNADNIENTGYVTTTAKNTWANAPTAQTAVAASTSQMNVTWAAGTGGANHYHVRSSSDGYATIKYDNTTASWNETTLSANTAYTYHIYAVNADNVENTVYVTTATKSTWPNAPTGQIATANSNTQMNLSWVAPIGGAYHYHVRSSSDAFASIKYDNATASWNETGLTANTSYTYRIYSTNSDNIENSSYVTTTARYTLANDPSTSPASGEWTNNSTVTFINQATGVAKYKYIWNQSSAQVTWTGSESDWTLPGSVGLTMSTAGSYYLHLISYNSDSPAVVGTKTDYMVGPFQYDNVPPSGTVLNWGTVTNNTASIIASGATDSQAGVPTAGYYIERDDNSTTFVTADANSGWITGTWNQTNLNANVAYTYRVKSRDNAGNESPWVSASPIYKYTLANAPVLDIPVSTSTNDNRPQLTNSTTPDISFKNRTIKLYEGSNVVATTTANNAGVFTFADGDYVSNLAEGAHTLTTTALNTVGTESAVSGPLTIFIDSVAPTTTLSTADVVPQPSGWYIANPIITLNVNDPAPSGGNGNTYYKWDDASFVNPTTYSGEINMNSSVGQGTHTLYYRAVDAASNTETLKSQIFKLDSVTPEGEVSIASGQYSTLNPVILNMSATDETSGVSKIYISNSGAPLEYCAFDYSTNQSLSWDLSGTTNPNCGVANTDDGDKTVYVKFGDVAGNVSIDFTATTVLDRTPPTNSTSVSAYSIPSQSTPDITSSAWANAANPKFVWTGAADNASGVKGYWVYFGTDQNAEPMMATDSSNLAYVDNDNNNFFEPTDHNSYVVLSHLTSGTTYYLKVRAQDNALYNADANYTESQNEFVYKYDGDAPAAISLIRVNPTGYSSLDSYTFEWDPVTDNAMSGLAKYQYRRANGTDAWTDLGIVPDPITGRIVTPAIQHYKEDDNMIEVRVVDHAGNVSATTEALYYYAGNIPAPTNLQVHLDQSQNQTVNKFSFSWDKAPTTEIQGYYISVNSQPNAQNSTFIAATDADSSIQTPYSAFATAKGLNQFWVATKARGTVGWQGAVSVEFSCNTAAPGIPTNVLITDSSNRDTQRWQVTVNWDQPADVTPDFNGYIVERSTDGENWQEMQTTSVKAVVDTDLLNTVTYSYRVYAKDSIGNKSAASSVVSMKPTGKYTSAPNLIGNVTSNVQATKVKVTWSTDRDCDSFVQIGLTDKYGLTQGQLDSTGAHYVQITGLTPGTVYHYSAIWRDVDGNIGHSTDQTFTTLDAPSISEVTVSDIRLDSAIISWTSSTIASSQVSYGKDYNYGSVASDQSSSALTVHVIKLDNLQNSSNYHFKIVSVDVDGNSVTSDDYSFSTLEFPVLSNITVDQLPEMPTSTVRVTWDSNVPISSVVNYTEVGGGTKEVAESTLVTKHSMTISNLKDNTNYIFSVLGRDQYGTEPTGNSHSVKTEFDTRPPVISNVTTETSVVGYGSDAKTQAIISWESDEAGTSQVEYDFGTFGTSYQFKTQEDAGLTTSHVVVLSGLKPSTSYHFRVVSRDASKNAGYSDDDTILTEQASSSILDIIVNSLQNSLGWLFGSFTSK